MSSVGRIIDSNGNYRDHSVESCIIAEDNQWKNWNCSAGLTGIYIDYDLNIWRGNCFSTNPDKWNSETKTYGFFATSEDRKKYPGLIGNPDIGYEWPEQDIRCPFKACACGADVLIDKWLDPNAPAVKTGDVVNPVRFESYIKEKHILWDIGRRCNYDCSYCWPSVHSKTEPYHLETRLFDVFDQIKNWMGDTPARWAFGGGEPTLYPGFKRLLSKIKEHNKDSWVTVTSNGSRTERYWEELFPLINGLNLSLHFEFADIEHYKHIFELSKKRIQFTSGKLMTVPGRVEESFDIAKQIGLRGHNWECMVVPIRDQGHSGAHEEVLQYTEKELELLRNQ